MSVLIQIRQKDEFMRTEKNLRQEYIESQFVPKNSRREKILKEILKVDKDGIQISPAEGQLIKVLARMIQAKKAVEIGTLLGYSTTWLLEAVGVDGHVWSFEKLQEHHRIAGELLKEDLQEGRLTLNLGDANEELPKISAKGPFDLIFIDANKGSYMDYFKWADENLRSGGLLIADNTFLFGLVYQDEAPENHKKAWEVMRELNRTLGSHPNYESILIPTSEGLTIAFKK